MDPGANTTSVTPRAIALIDSVATGHHIDYCARVAGAVLEQQLRCVVIGPPELVAAVRSTHPSAHGEALVSATDAVRVGRDLARLRFVRRAAAIVQSENVDAAHLLNLDGMGVALAATRRRFGGAALFGTLHRRHVFDAPSHDVRQRLECVALRRLVARGLRVLVHGAALAEAVASHTRGPAPIEIPIPVSASDAAPAHARQAREQLGLDAGARYLLAFGGTRHEKGVDLAIASLGRLTEDVRLVVAGPEEHFSASDLRTLAERHGVADRVELRLGFVPRADVGAWFDAVDAVVLPYRRTFSGQSGPLTIAAARGRPVVVSDGPITGATVRTYDLGIAVPAEDVAALARGIERVLRTPPTPDTTSFLRDFSLATFGQRLMAGYRSGA